MKQLKKLFSLLTFLLITVSVFGQGGNSPTDSLMRSHGRIYVVVAVMLTILVGLILYIVRLDRKISKMEKRN